MTKRPVHTYKTGYDGVVWMIQPMRLKMLEAIKRGPTTHGGISTKTGACRASVSRFVRFLQDSGVLK